MHLKSFQFLDEQSYVYAWPCSRVPKTEGDKVGGAAWVWGDWIWCLWNRDQGSLAASRWQEEAMSSGCQDSARQFWIATAEFYWGGKIIQLHKFGIIDRSKNAKKNMQMSNMECFWNVPYFNFMGHAIHDRFMVSGGLGNLKQEITRNTHHMQMNINMLISWRSQFFIRALKHFLYLG